HGRERYLSACKRRKTGLVAQRLGVGLPETRGHGGQQLARERRHRVEHTAELALAEHQHVEVVGGLYRGRSRATVEQRQLAEVLTPAERRDLAAVAQHVGRAVEDEEELVTRLPLLDEDVTGLDMDLVGRPPDLLELLLRARREHGHASQVVEVVVTA